MTDKPNTFEELESQETPKSQTPVKTTGEIDLTNFSDVAVGEKVKYVRPNLDGKEDVIDSFKVFMPDPEKDELLTSQSGASKYWKVSMLLSYESENDDGVQNKEYISGARSFEQKDGSPSAISFWYDGAETQSAMLWEKVATALKIAPDELSPRQFVAFLNNKPKVIIEGRQYKNYNAKPGAPKEVSKNMPGVFI